MKKLILTIIFIAGAFFIKVQCQTDFSSKETEIKSFVSRQKNRPDLINDAITGINSNKSNKQIKRMASTVNHHMNTLYFGVSKNTPKSEMKENSFCTNIIGFNAGLFIPGPTARSVANFSYGLCLGFELFHSNKYKLNALPAPYNISGQKAPPTIASNIPKLKGTKYEFGLQFNILVAKNFVISPIFSFGTMYIYQRKYSVTQTTRMNSGLKTYEISSTNLPTVLPRLHILNSSTSNDDKSSFLITKLRMQYCLGSRFGCWAEFNYMFGPELYYTTMEFYPDGTPDQNGEYSISQMDAGYSIPQTNIAKFNSFGLNFGIAIALGSEEENGVISE